ncbi:MAG TPA: hypothetical protein VL048_10470 [Xanthobacteraceae bacterium]|nr:hypothetical protein [Xanthobacteraceae bacterium]
MGSLVLDSRLMEDADGNEWAAITAAYGTGADNIRKFDSTKHLLISNGEFRALGLHKPTIFQLDLGNRRPMPWAEEYFVTQGYVRNQRLICGSLNEDQQKRFQECFTKQGLDFPLP